MEPFRFLDINEWTGQDCLDWATTTCLQLGLKFYEVEIEGFGFVTGAQLSTFTERDFYRKIGHLHGAKFFKAFNKMLIDRREQESPTGESNTYANVSEHEHCDSTDSQASSMTPLNLNDPYDSNPCGGGAYRENYHIFPQNQSVNSYCTPPSLYQDCYRLRDLNSERNTPEYIGHDFHSVNYEEPYYQPLARSENNENIYETKSTTNESIPFSGHHEVMRDDRLNDSNPACRAGIFQQELEYTTDTRGAMSQAVCLSEPPSALSSTERKWKQKIKNKNRPKRVRDPFVWEFLLMLLQDSDFNPSYIKWENEQTGIFKLVQKEEVAREWGERTEKHKDAPLTYGHFSRSLRYHYTSGNLQPVSEKHLVYRFGPKVMELHFNREQN